MTVWERLGIEPTADIKKIKSAYAAAAKQWHPEEHPEEFQALQKAYKMACAYAKRQPQIVRPISAPEIQVRIVPKTPETPEKEQNPQPEPVSESVPPYIQEPESVHIPEPDFDFSEVDAYGQKEQFFREFFLIAKNPCLMNNLHTWELFLNQSCYAALFTDTAFRMNFVRTLCGLWGWRRKTLLYIEKFLETFHVAEELPPDGKWETQLGCFLRKKRPRIPFSVLKKDVYGTREGIDFQDKIMAVFRRQKRVINFKNKRDVMDYMRVYLAYAYTREETVNWLYRQRKNTSLLLIGMMSGLFFFMALMFLLTGTESDERKEKVQEQEIQEKWLEELEKVPDRIPQRRTEGVYIEDGQETENRQETESGEGTKGGQDPTEDLKLREKVKTGGS